MTNNVPRPRGSGAGCGTGFGFFARVGRSADSGVRSRSAGVTTGGRTFRIVPDGGGGGSGVRAGNWSDELGVNSGARVLGGRGTSSVASVGRVRGVTISVGSSYRVSGPRASANSRADWTRPAGSF